MIRSVTIGRFDIFADDSGVVGRDVLENGLGYELHIRRELERLIPKSRGFIDVGANIGLHTLSAKEISAEIPVMCFEPSCKNVPILKKNILHNRLGGVTVRRVALADHAGVVHANRDELNLQCTPAGKSDDFPFEIECSKLDSFDTSGFDLMKIDVEGFEYSTWLGSSIFFSNRPTVIFELCPEMVHRSNITPKEQLDWIISQGYQLTVLDNKQNGGRLENATTEQVLNHPNITEFKITDILAEPVGTRIGGQLISFGSISGQRLRRITTSATDGLCSGGRSEPQRI